MDRQLLYTEKKNLQVFGYGIKGFVLSMIETSIQLTKGEISGNEIEQIMDFGREMLTAPIQLLEHVEDTLQHLQNNYTLLLITKGDLIDQETKIARSGLSDYFNSIEIISEKNVPAYQKILDKHQIQPERFLMVGNSIRSDILPVLEMGGTAVYVPYEIDWAHEHDSKPSSSASFHKMKHLGKFPGWLKTMEVKTG